ncbi:hypothetical protein ABZ807_25355 [Micromonospora sp. NPDC047548]|uniref:hypothetical protein n=1 Tax=Micromonospora sp. NPDC047548 TaxID=3155624 RepID=UPI0033C1E588
MEEKLLAPLRDVPLPPSAVDLHRAVRDGRRQVRRRRVAATATAGLAVVAVLAAAPALLGRPDRPAPVTPAITPSPSAAPMPARAPAAFDPARQYADFGWLPAGLTGRMVATGTAQLALNASPLVDVASPDRRGGAMVDLRIVSAGHDIAFDAPSDFAVPVARGGSAGLEPAEPVNGRTARWNTLASDPRGAALRWEYAPDTWAELTVQGASEGSDPRALARRIALDVRYGVQAPVRLPVHFASFPASLKPMAYVVGTAADGTWNVDVSYGAGRRTKYGDWPLTVHVMPRACTPATTRCRRPGLDPGRPPRPPPLGHGWWCHPPGVRRPGSVRGAGCPRQGHPAGPRREPGRPLPQRHPAPEGRRLALTSTGWRNSYPPPGLRPLLPGSGGACER